MIDLKAAIDLAVQGTGRRPSTLIVDAIVNHADAFERQGFTSDVSQVHFISQCAVESTYFTTLYENLNYTTFQGLNNAWPSRFKTAAQAAPYIRNPEKLANYVYGGRMGNTRPGDGWKHRGQGILQVTGFNNVETLAKEMGISHDEALKRLTSPEYMLECALIIFKDRGALRFAEQDNARQVSLRVNGGENGMQERLRITDRLRKRFLTKKPSTTPSKTKIASAAPVYASATAVPEPVTPVVPEAPSPMPEEKAKSLQKRLVELGYAPNVNNIDGDWGPGMESTVFLFQAEHGLPKTGQLDEATEKAIWTAEPRVIPKSRAEATADDLRDKGSTTIAAADGIETAAKVAVSAGGLGGIASAIQTASDVTSAGTQAQQAAQNATGLWAYVSTNWLSVIALICAAIAIYVVWTRIVPRVKEIIATRVKEHQNLTNVNL